MAINIASSAMRSLDRRDSVCIGARCMPAQEGQNGHVRIGVDIGGTFTDLLMFDESTKSFTVGKTLTTSAEPADGVRTGLSDVMRLGNQSPRSVNQIVHGTTLVTNALIE